MGRIILTSQGLTQKSGYHLIAEELQKEDLSHKKIYLFHEPYYSIEPLLIRACMFMGFSKENIYLAGSDVTQEMIEDMDVLYVSEGNTFDVLRAMQEREVLEPMRCAYEKGAIYIGSSAGALIGGTDIILAGDFDRNHDNLTDLTGLGIYSGVTIPHYSKAELERYIMNSDPEIIEKYENIYSVADGEKLIL